MSDLVPASWRDSVDGLRNRVSHAFDRWMPHRSEPEPTKLHEHWLDKLVSAKMPAVDMDEDDNTLTVTAELPGLDKKDFHVELEDRRLIVRGEKKTSREDKKRNYYYAESSYGSFYRAIPLPCEVVGDKVQATYKRGVLTVTMPKTEEAKARSVRVKVD